MEQTKARLLSLLLGWGGKPVLPNSVSQKLVRFFFPRGFGGLGGGGAGGGGGVFLSGDMIHTVCIMYVCEFKIIR